MRPSLSSMAAPTRNLENGAKALRRAARAAAISGSDTHNTSIGRTRPSFARMHKAEPYATGPHLLLQPRQQGLQEPYQGIAHHGAGLEDFLVMDFLRQNSGRH